MNWGKSIVLVFILFAAFIGTLVAVCIGQDVTLVSKDYYQEELAFQQQINRLENTDALAEKPKIHFNGKKVEVRYNGLARLDEGRLEIFCPSNAALDVKFEMRRLSGGTAEFAMALPAGFYRARMTWKEQGMEYYFEEVIII